MCVVSLIIIYLHLAASGLSLCMQDLHSVMQDLPVWCMVSLVAVHGLSCSAACGILFPNQGLNLHPLYCKADSLPLDHQGSPWYIFK